MGRADFAFSPDGTAVGRDVGDTAEQFYDFTGDEVAVPADQKHLEWYVDAGSPRAGGSPPGLREVADWQSSSWIVDPRTGRKTEVRGQQLIAWVGDSRSSPGTSRPRTSTRTGS